MCILVIWGKLDESSLENCPWQQTTTWVPGQVQKSDNVHLDYKELTVY
jgi:hypothetical protein